MDTRLKTTHKKKNLIIALCILVPALILTSLYPAMDKAVTKKRQQIEYEAELMREEEPDTYIQDNFINYAVEASYYMYSLVKVNDEDVINLLEEYGWSDDYYFTVENTEYYLECGDKILSNYEGGKLQELISIGKNNTRDIGEELKKRELKACFILEFDNRGNVVYTDFFQAEEYDAYDQISAMEKVDASIEQFEENASYNEWSDKKISKAQPKNLKVVYTISPDSEFVIQNELDTPYYSHEGIYWEIGGILLVLIMAAVVAIAAMVLPFFKSLETGWERIFSLPVEIMLIICSFAMFGAFLMTEFMCLYNSLELFREVYAIEFLGMTITPEVAYAGYLLLNFLGWSACFFMEYIVVTSIRQFLCGPRYYIRNRILCINVLRFMWMKVKGFFRRSFNILKDICRRVISISKELFKQLTNIRFEELNRGIAKIAIVNTGVLVALLIMYCWIEIGWLPANAILLAIVFAIPHAIIIYMLLIKYMTKVKAQHDIVLDATTQIADGNFKIAFDEDLGAFTQIGNELGRIQEGFSKAVAEEAKSQSMKSELITNVSHDLKTPLTSIITYVDLLGKDGITEEERKSYLATLEQKSQRLKMLIEDLFEVSKANSGNMKLELMDVDIVNLMKEVRLELEDKIKDSTLDFKWNLPEEKVILHLDGRKTYRIFTNLLNNILKYAMEHSRVYVDLKEDVENVTVIFRNISAKELNFDAERLTERFVRGDESRNTDGSGLGLAIVKSFVELQGGTFKIDVDGDLFKATIIWKK